MSDREMSPQMSPQLSPQMYVRRNREPRSEPWIIQGLKLMEQERKASKINRINLKKEQLLFQKQARREARSRALSGAKSTEAARPDLMASGTSMEDSDEEYPTSQWRYMERKYLREQGITRKSRRPLRNQSASTVDKEQLDIKNNTATDTQPAADDASTEPSAELSAEPSAELSAEPSAELSAEPSAELSADPNAELNAEPSAELSAEPSAELSVEPIAELTAEPSAELSAEPSTQAVDKKKKTGVEKKAAKKKYEVSLDHDKNCATCNAMRNMVASDNESSTESEGSGSYEDDYVL